MRRDDDGLLNEKDVCQIKHLDSFVNRKRLYHNKKPRGPSVSWQRVTDETEISKEYSMARESNKKKRKRKKRHWPVLLEFLFESSQLFGSKCCPGSFFVNLFLSLAFLCSSRSRSWSRIEYECQMEKRGEREETTWLSVIVYWEITKGIEGKMRKKRYSHVSRKVWKDLCLLLFCPSSYSIFIYDTRSVMKEVNRVCTECVGRVYSDHLKRGSTPCVSLSLPDVWLSEVDTDFKGQSKERKGKNGKKQHRSLNVWIRRVSCPARLLKKEDQHPFQILFHAFLLSLYLLHSVSTANCSDSFVLWIPLFFPLFLVREEEEDLSHTQQSVDFSLSKESVRKGNQKRNSLNILFSFFPVITHPFEVNEWWPWYPLKGQKVSAGLFWQEYPSN